MSDERKRPYKDVIARILAEKKKHVNSMKADHLSQRILDGEKAALSEAITLIESTKSMFK